LPILLHLLHLAPPLVATPNPLPPSNRGPPSGMGTKSGEGHTNQSSPETTTSLVAEGDTYSTSGLHVPPSNATQGEETVRRNDGSCENTTRHLIFCHHQQGEHRRSRGAKGGHSPNHDSSHQPMPASPRKSKPVAPTKRRGIHQAILRLREVADNARRDTRTLVIASREYIGAQRRRR